MELSNRVLPMDRDITTHDAWEDQATYPLAGRCSAGLPQAAIIDQ